MGSHWLINGSKIFITNGYYADIYFVGAVTDPSKGSRGISAFIVEKDTPGFSFGKKEKKMGIRGSATHELVFEDCKIPKENLIGELGTGFKKILATLDGGRIGVAAQALGIAQSSIDRCKEYVTEVTVSWSINTLDEEFKNDMDKAVSSQRRLAAMKQVYEAGIRTVCFISPVFPGITDFEAIFERIKNQCDLVWLENLNLRSGFKKDIMDYIAEKYPYLMPQYDAIYNKGDRSYFKELEQRAEALALSNGCPFLDNELPYGRSEKGASCHCRLFLSRRNQRLRKYRETKI